jgi:rare lipoprotein A
MSFNIDDKSSSASWYGYSTRRITASREVFDNNKLTAAHKTLKFGTKVEVTNTDNNKSVVVKVNDRGPFVKGRDIDLSKGAFKQIASLKSGIIKVKYKVVN